MVSVELKDTFLQLVRLGIGHAETTEITEKVDRVALKAFAEEQGLTAIVLDGLNTDGTDLTDTMPVQMKLEWIGEVLQNYEAKYAAYEKAIGSLAGWYNKHGFKMMVLKGYACAQDWPNPKHRPCGDIDIWLFGKQKEADTLLASLEFSVESLESGEKVQRIKVDNSHHHHTVFNWQGFSVENHYDFINVHHHKSHIEFEKILKELGQEDSHAVEVNGEKVHLPSPNLHALFLIKHLMLHFSTGEITLRQLLDWAFFVEKHGKEIDWLWLEEILNKYGMRDLYNVFNAICVGDLGFSVNIFPQVQFSPELKDRVLKDILSPEFDEEMPRNVLKRIIWKWHRWKANEWKHKLCYKESMWSAFWSGVWGHLLKPSSI